jgi:AcrR family transcriptional regulator
MSQVKGSRREKAAATRRGILRAAHDEFVEKGYHGATIASIAARAGVATQTVYYVFHTKAALISAAIDLLVMGEEEPVVPQDTEWWQAMVAEDDAGRALRHFVSGAAVLFQRASALSEILRAAALTDEEVRRTYEFHERLRAEGFREVIEVLSTKGSLRAGLTVESATDVLLVVFGDSTYHLLTHDRGWSHDDVVAWFGASLPTLLLDAGS